MASYRWLGVAACAAADEREINLSSAPHCNNHGNDARRQICNRDREHRLESRHREESVPEPRMKHALGARELDACMAGGNP